MDNEFPPESKIEDLKKDLYSLKKDDTVEKPRTIIPREKGDVGEDWQHNEVKIIEEIMNVDQKKPHHASPLRKVLLFSVFFFIASVLIGFYTFFSQSNVVSSDNVMIDVVGPVSVGGGEELPIEIVIKNKNNTALQATDLLVTFPPGTRKAGDVGKEFLRFHEVVGEIEPGQEVRRKIGAVLFGEANSQAQIVIDIEYRVVGSNAIFQKEKKYDLVLTSAPVSMTVNSIKEITSGQEFEITVEVQSNSTTLIENLLLKGEFGFGYKFISATPFPTYGTDTWKLGDLKAGDKRTIKIKGQIQGQDGEERSFRFNTGIQDPLNENALSTIFLTETENITLSKPFLGVDLSFDGDMSSEHPALSGSRVQGVISWKNNLPTRIIDVEIEAKLSGQVLDRSSVTSESGFYRSFDNTIIWNKSTSESLGILNPGDSGSIRFYLSSIKLDSILASGLKNQEITVSINAKGKRTSESQVPETINVLATKKIKLSTQAELMARAVRSVGPFQNTGPLPPRADIESTYTIMLSLKNSLNAISDGQVTLFLPQYIRWMGVISPASERLVYDNGKLVWSVGEMAAGAGYSSAPREVAFQVAFLPSVSQVGTLPSLVQQIKFQGRDRFTGGTITADATNVSTQIGTDPSYKGGDEIVRQ